MVRRAAFTLIELIFAIVIIAISVISLPMMSQTVSEGIDANIVQEAIFASATELNEAVTAHWDENSIEASMPDSSARVIETVINMILMLQKMNLKLSLLVALVTGLVKLKVLVQQVK